MGWNSLNSPQLNMIEIVVFEFPKSESDSVLFNFRGAKSTEHRSSLNFSIFLYAEAIKVGKFYFKSTLYNNDNNNNNLNI